MTYRDDTQKLPECKITPPLKEIYHSIAVQTLNKKHELKDKKEDTKLIKEKIRAKKDLHKACIHIKKILHDEAAAGNFGCDIGKSRMPWYLFIKWNAALVNLIVETFSPEMDVTWLYSTTPCSLRFDWRQ
jgi:hypothetical protein